MIGAVIFLYKPNIFEKETSIVIGYSLVGFSLVMNGCEAGVEEKLRSTARPSSLNFMLYINAWSSLFLITAVAVTGEFPEFIAFCMKNSMLSCSDSQEIFQRSFLSALLWSLFRTPSMACDRSHFHGFDGRRNLKFRAK